MAHAKSINMFLPTGAADGPIELEMLNWNGSVIKLPRKEVHAYSGIELNTPGIYFLFCKKDNSENKNDLVGESVYIGESENLLLRLKQHIQDHNTGKEKFFWQTAVCAFGKDLNKALVKYLENYYCQLMKNSSRYVLLTKKSSPQMTLKRSEQAAMHEFIENVNILMGTIGCKLSDNSDDNVNLKDLFYCKTKTGADAKGYMSEDGFVVLPGSKVAASATSKTFEESIYKELYDTLIDTEVIADGVFQKEYSFSSPTAAADVVTKSNVSGNLYWVDVNGKTLKEHNM